MRNLFFALFLSFFVSGCGYKPASFYAKQIIGDKTFVDVKINLQDPKNSVIAKDALLEILTSRLRTTIVDKEADADVVMHIQLRSVSLTELGYDAQGYITTYRANVVLVIDYKTATKTGTITVKGNHDFSLDGAAAVTQNKRFDAIRIASDKALQDFLSRVAILFFK